MSDTISQITIFVCRSQAHMNETVNADINNSCTRRLHVQGSRGGFVDSSRCCVFDLNLTDPQYQWRPLVQKWHYFYGYNGLGTTTNSTTLNVLQASVGFLGQRTSPSRGLCIHRTRHKTTRTDDQVRWYVDSRTTLSTPKWTSVLSKCSRFLLVQR